MCSIGDENGFGRKIWHLRGTCLNVGCIPSKALLDSSHHFEDTQKHLEGHGIEISGEVKLNLAKMMERKSGVVSQTTKGIDFLMDKNKIEIFHGLGSFQDAHTLTVIGKEQTISGKHFIIATGKLAAYPY